MALSQVNFKRSWRSEAVVPGGSTACFGGCWREESLLSRHAGNPTQRLQGFLYSSRVVVITVTCTQNGAWMRFMPLPITQRVYRIDKFVQCMCVSVPAPAPSPCVCNYLVLRRFINNYYALRWTVIYKGLIAGVRYIQLYKFGFFKFLFYSLKATYTSCQYRRENCVLGGAM